MIVLTRCRAESKSKHNPDVDDFSSVILEIISVMDKDVLCLVDSDNLLQGLKKRGARVAEEIVSQKEISSFDVVIYDDYGKICKKDILANEFSTFLFLVPSRIFSVNFGLMRVSLKWANYKVASYSIFPSFSDVKLIIPDGISFRATRYWSLRSEGLSLTVKNILLWILFQWNVTRVLFSRKVLIFHACSGNQSK